MPRTGAFCSVSFFSFLQSLSVGVGVGVGVFVTHHSQRRIGLFCVVVAVAFSLIPLLSIDNDGVVIVAIVSIAPVFI